MRCLFTMFAEDVELLPEGRFRELLERLPATSPTIFPRLVDQLWGAMDDGRLRLLRSKRRCDSSTATCSRTRTVLPLAREEIGELVGSRGERDWREVEPAIFGTLLEQALDPDERRRLGAHYTPRAYVERLVDRDRSWSRLREDWRHGAGRGRAA